MQHLPRRLSSTCEPSVMPTVLLFCIQANYTDHLFNTSTQEKRINVLGSYHQLKWTERWIAPQTLSERMFCCKKTFVFVFEQMHYSAKLYTVAEPGICITIFLIKMITTGCSAKLFFERLEASQKLSSYPLSTKVSDTLWCFVYNTSLKMYFCVWCLYSCSSRSCG